MGFQRFLDREDKDRDLAEEIHRTWHMKWMPTAHAVFRTLKRADRFD
ncbi:hypothetical protein [Edaphobacter aggregans]|nr:hypothetical protein [Edaphobacter aggregans]